MAKRSRRYRATQQATATLLARTRNEADGPLTDHMAALRLRIHLDRVAADIPQPEQPSKEARIKRERERNRARLVQERAGKLKGLIKWQGRMPTLHYHRQGFAWVNGQYVKTQPKATGLTMAFDAPYEGRGRRSGRRLMASRLRRGLKP